MKSSQALDLMGSDSSIAKLSGLLSFTWQFDVLFYLKQVCVFQFGQQFLPNLPIVTQNKNAINQTKITSNVLVIKCKVHQPIIKYSIHIPIFRRPDSFNYIWITRKKKLGILKEREGRGGRNLFYYSFRLNKLYYHGMLASKFIEKCLKKITKKTD